MVTLTIQYELIYITGRPTIIFGGVTHREDVERLVVGEKSCTKKEENVATMLAKLSLPTKEFCPGGLL